MRLVRYAQGRRAAWGICDPAMDVVYALVGRVYGRFAPGAPVGQLADLHLLAPCAPRKVVALAYNYKDLVGEKASYDEPLIFLKPPTAVIGPGEPIRVPAGVDVVWAEVELAFVIKKRARDVAPERAGQHILGYTIANDVTAQNICGRDWHLARSKGLDTFCPVGPFLETTLDTGALALSTTINGTTTQQSTTAQRILDDAQTLSLVSRFITLDPGDLVLTGTPAGALDSRVRPGDRVTVRIAGLGELTNPVVARDTSWRAYRDRCASHRTGGELGL